MLNRLTVSLSFVLLALVASTGAAYAADDREEVAIGAFAVAAGLMALLAIVYAIKHALGLDKMAPAEPEAGDHH